MHTSTLICPTSLAHGNRAGTTSSTSFGRRGFYTHILPCSSNLSRSSVCINAGQVITTAYSNTCDSKEEILITHNAVKNLGKVAAIDIKGNLKSKREIRNRLAAVSIQGFGSLGRQGRAIHLFKRGCTSSYDVLSHAGNRLELETTERNVIRHRSGILERCKTQVLSRAGNIRTLCSSKILNLINSIAQFILEILSRNFLAIAPAMSSITIQLSLQILVNTGNLRECLLDILQVLARGGKLLIIITGKAVINFSYLLLVGCNFLALTIAIEHDAAKRQRKHGRECDNSLIFTYIHLET